MRPVDLLPCAAILLLSCGGEKPASLGVLVNEIGLSRTDAGKSPADLSGRGLDGSLRKVLEADITGDAAPERIVERRDLKALEVTDPSAGETRTFRTTDYITGFAAAPSASGGKHDLVVYTYPNERGGGTFRVIDGSFRELTRWEESPPPGGIAAGTHDGRPAVYYLQDERLVIRATDGSLIARLAAPQSGPFRPRAVDALADGRFVLLGSGEGYSPYHMVAVYEPDGRLVFQAMAREHAFALEIEPGGEAFTVLARSRRWKYAPGGRVP